MVNAGDEAIVGSDTLAQGGDGGVREFPLVAAAAADEMVVALFSQLIFAGAVAEIGLADEAEITEEFQIAVDGAAIEPGDAAFDTGEDFVGGEVPPLLQCAEDDEPLRGGALADGAETPGEAFPIGVLGWGFGLGRHR